MLERIARVGRHAALTAGALLRHNYYKPHEVTMKGAIDPVTDSDLMAQELIMGLIHQAFQEHDFLAEEDVAEPAASMEAQPGQPLTGHPALPCRWIIDPLDGTVNFAHGFPMFCVSIAAELNRELVYGAVYDPLRDELFEAVQGQGATLNSRPLRVSATASLERALLATGFPYDIRQRLPETLARMGRVLNAAQGLRRAGAAALDMAYVAAGRLDGFFEEKLKPWDTAAGILLIAEAGGVITTFNGAPYHLHSLTILASNGLLHEAIAALLGP